ncbi:hypothetical protein [Paracoccus sediminicola]|uniref:hypothetical protein n=1 Tax=Paracoccus sediminicola TaxID=3017783 RepID=UPI0022F04D44|nr:hypothetical protein [Paracoccus sediminicola]WBU56435.1 hypothetical protein PAF18_13290 [Paracoccus sediminicola]
MLASGKKRGIIPIGFLPQHRFVAPETEIFHVERDFDSRIAARFGFEKPETREINKSKHEQLELTDDMVDWVRNYYAKDFETFGYDRPS